jgi:hypothetical protein
MWERVKLQGQQHPVCRIEGCPSECKAPSAAAPFIYYIHIIVISFACWGGTSCGRTGAHGVGAQPALVCTDGTSDAYAASSGVNIVGVKLNADGTDTAVGAAAAAVATHLHMAGFAKKLITKYD